MRSPFVAIAAYEEKLGIPANYLNCSMYVHSFDIFRASPTLTVLTFAMFQHRPRSQWGMAEI